MKVQVSIIAADLDADGQRHAANLECEETDVAASAVEALARLKAHVTKVPLIVAKRAEITDLRAAIESAKADVEDASATKDSARIAPKVEALGVLIDRLDDARASLAELQQA